MSVWAASVVYVWLFAPAAAVVAVARVWHGVCRRVLGPR